MSEATAVQVVWWIGLVVALGLTFVVVKQLVDLLRTLGHLRALAERAAAAAEGLADAVRRPSGLDAAAEAADGVQAGAAALEAAAEAVRETMTGASRKVRKRRGPWRHPTGGPGLDEIGGAVGGLLNGGGS